ncbi:MAG: S8 family serine peptidase, partial [Actinobacteria bacterium]|nr:S8 family serine peptidase [Actinomycetota bacterium]
RPAPANPPGSLGRQVRAAELSALHAVGVPSAWRVSRGQGVTVAVLDTGVKPGVADLTGSVITGPDFTLGADPPGFRPPHLHGTYIASLIAGHGSGPGRADGVIGIAPSARILSVRVLLDDSEPGINVYNASPRYGDAVGKGVRYAVRHGAKVINMSLGSATATRGLRAAIAYAISHDVVVVAAAGNGGSNGTSFTPYSYPAAYPGVIGVAAVGASGIRAGFSDRNASVVLSAPGVNVVGAGPGGYIQASGTSPASAFVAGVAALIRSAYPRLSPALVEQALIASAGDRPSAGYSTSVGFGEVSAVGALHAAARLAARKPATGLSPQARAGSGAPGPIQVVHRDTARIMALGGVGAAGAAGFLAAVAALIVLARRAARDRRAARPLPSLAGPPPAAGHPAMRGYPPLDPGPPPGYRADPEPQPRPPGYPGTGTYPGEQGRHPGEAAYPWEQGGHPGAAGHPGEQDGYPGEAAHPGEQGRYPGPGSHAGGQSGYPELRSPYPGPPRYPSPGPFSEPPGYPSRPASEPPGYSAPPGPAPEPPGYPATPPPGPEAPGYPVPPGPTSEPPGYPAQPPGPEPSRDDDAEPPTEDLGPPLR